MIRREGAGRRTRGGAVRYPRQGIDRLCVEANRTIGHGVAAQTISVEVRPQLTGKDSSDIIVDQAVVSDGTHSVHEVGPILDHCLPMEGEHLSVKGLIMILRDNSPVDAIR